MFVDYYDKACHGFGAGGMLQLSNENIAVMRQTLKQKGFAGDVSTIPGTVRKFSSAGTLF